MLYFPFGLAVEVGAGVELEFEAVAVAVGTGLSDESGASEASGELVGSAESGVAEGSIRCRNDIRICTVYNVRKRYYWHN